MRIGIDFDNTIACYDGVFHAAALERGLIPPELGRDKNSVRDHLNGTGRKDEFTELQGHVYGARMDLVSLYPGFAEFVVAAHRTGHDLFVVSHKTMHPILGPKHDLHAAARGFLAARDLVGRAPEQIEPSKLFRDEPDVRQLIKLRAVYEVLEELTDVCKDVAAELEAIVLGHLGS